MRHHIRTPDEALPYLNSIDIADLLLSKAQYQAELCEYNPKRLEY